MAIYEIYHRDGGQLWRYFTGTQWEYHSTVWIDYRRKFRSQTADNMDKWKSRGGKSQRGEVKKWEEQRRERVRRKNMQVREKVGKTRFTVFFHMICGSGWSKSRLAQAAGAEPSVPDERWKIARRCGANHISKSKCTKQHTFSDHFWKLWCRKSARRVARSSFRDKTHFQRRTTIGSCRCRKLHAVAARSPVSDHFWKLRCRKTARRCGAKHISKWKCVNALTWSRTTFGSWDVEKVHAVVEPSTFSSQECRTQSERFGPRLEVEMSKKCTPLWREAHFQVKIYKVQHVRTIFGSCDVEKVRAVGWGAKHISKSKCTKHHTYGPLLTVQMWFCVAGARDCAPCQKWAKPEGFVAISTTTTNALRYTTLHYTLLHCTALHYTKLHCTTLHYITLHHNTLHYTTPHHTTVHYTTLRYTPPHYTTLHCTALHYYIPTTLHYATLHSTPLHYTHTTLHYTTLHYITLHYSTLHPATLHLTTLHSTTLHSTTLHYTTLRYNLTALRFTTLTTTTTTTTTLFDTTLHYIAPPYITVHQTHYTSTI